MACVCSLISTAWTRSVNVSTKSKHIDTFIFRVDVIDMLFRQQFIQIHIQIKRFLANFMRFQYSHFFQLLEIFCGCLAFRDPRIHEKLALGVRLQKIVSMSSLE